MRNKERTPLQVVLYGQPGIGKTTFAKIAREPFFIDLENGSIGIAEAKKKSFPIIGLITQNDQFELMVSTQKSVLKNMYCIPRYWSKCVKRIEMTF